MASYTYTYRSKQTIILVIGLAVLGLIGLFPPRVASVDILKGNEVSPGYTEPAGRAFLFAPGEPLITEKTLVIQRSIDYSRLVVEWIVVGLFTAMAFGIVSLAEERNRELQPAPYDEQPKAA